MSSPMFRPAKALRLMAAAALLAALTPSLLIVPAAHAATINVTTSADELAVNGACSLREAIQAVNLDTVVDTCDPSGDADTIVLPADTYLLSISGSDENGAASGDLDITSALTITGALSSTTLIDGGQLDRVFDIFGGANVTLVGLTIQHGDSGLNGQGGAVRNAGNLTLQSSAVISSTAAEFSGGGIASNGALSLINSTIAGNSAHTGGGVENAGALKIDQSLIRQNASESSGGGIASLSGTLAISDSSIISNTSELGG